MESWAAFGMKLDFSARLVHVAIQLTLEGCGVSPLTSTGYRLECFFLKLSKKKQQKKKRKGIKTSRMTKEKEKRRGGNDREGVCRKGIWRRRVICKTHFIAKTDVPPRIHYAQHTTLRPVSTTLHHQDTTTP